MAKSLFQLGEPQRVWLHRVKYGSRIKWIDRLPFDISSDIEVPRTADTVWIPVPLYPKRLIERGFNQSELLARHFARHYGGRTSQGLVRTRETGFQARLSKKARLRNVTGRFAWDHSYAVPSSVILVDDVFTTGATLVSCAIALIRAGVASVSALTLFRA